MLTNIDIDDKKIRAIMKIAKIKTKKEAVNLALDELLKKITRQEVHTWKGDFSWEGNLEEMRKD